MDARLTIKTTERAKTKLKERAAAKEMSIGEYLDWMSQQSAVKNDLAPMAQPAPIQTTPMAHPAAIQTNPPPKPLMEVLGREFCQTTDHGHHVKGGTSPTGVRRCQKCGRTFINNQWTDNFHTDGLALTELQPLKQTDDESALSSYETGFRSE